MKASEFSRLAKWLVVLALFFMLTLCAWGQMPALSPGNSLPAWLPIGDQQTIASWIVTNRSGTFSIFVECTNSTGTVEEGISIVGSPFASYAAYKQWIGSNGMARLAALQKATNVTSHIRFFSVIYNTVGSQNALYTAQIVDTDLGPIQGITSASFINALATPEAEQILVTVTNLQQFSVIDSDPPYSFTWQLGSSEIKSVNPHPVERTTNNLLVLSQWYSMATNRVRFTITAGGSTMSYTQHGAPLIALPSVMADNKTLIASIPKGADVVVQSSQSLSPPNWQTFTSYPWLLGTNRILVPIDSSQPKLFFRTSCN